MEYIYHQNPLVFSIIMIMNKIKTGSFSLQDSSNEWQSVGLAGLASGKAIHPLYPAQGKQEGSV